VSGRPLLLAAAVLAVTGLALLRVTPGGR